MPFHTSKRFKSVSSSFARIGRGVKITAREIKAQKKKIEIDMKNNDAMKRYKMPYRALTPKQQSVVDNIVRKRRKKQAKQAVRLAQKFFS